MKTSEAAEVLTGFSVATTGPLVGQRELPMKDRPKEALRAGRNGTPWRSFKPKEGQGRAEGIREPGLSSVFPAPSSPTMAVSRRRAKPVAGDNPVRWRKQAAGHLEGDGSRDDARLEA